MRFPNLYEQLKLINVRGMPFVQNLCARAYYTSLNDDQIRATRKSDTVFLFGSGYSVNHITPAEWSEISKHDTLSFNWFIHQNFVRIDYHLIREICHGDLDPSIWKPKIHEYARLLCQNPYYKDCIYLIQKGWKAINGNRMLGMKLLPKDTPVFRYFNRARGIYEPPSESFSKGIVHGAGTLIDCVNFAYIMGWKHIVLVGLDLYDRRYFWLQQDETRDADTLRGATHQDQHNMANSLIPYLKDWRAHFQTEKKEIFVFNPKSLLAQVLPVFSISNIS